MESLSFFKQKIKMTNYENRLPFFLNLINNRTVLHVGCADYPIYNPQTNLHICLYTANHQVDGSECCLIHLAISSASYSS